MFDIHQNGVNIRYDFQNITRFCAPFCFNRCIPALGFASFEQFTGKIRLHERVAAGQRNAAAGMPKRRPIFLQYFNQLAHPHAVSFHDQGTYRARCCAVSLSDARMIIKMTHTIIGKADCVLRADAFTASAVHTFTFIVHNNGTTPLRFRIAAPPA